MKLQTHHRPVGLDLDRCQSALARRPGTLLLHTGVNWRGSGRSALLFAPQWTWRQRRGEPARLEGCPPVGLDAHRSPLRWPFEHFLGSDRAPAEPCFCGVAGYYSYECGLGGAAVEGVPSAAVEGVPSAAVEGVPSAAVEGVPSAAGIRPASRALFDVDDVWLGAYDRALVVEPDGRLVLHVADLGPLDGDPRPLDERWTEAHRTLVEAQAEPDSTPPAPRLQESPRFFSREWHRDRVEAIHHHLRAGDCYQINLTGFASARTGVDPHRAFLRETRSNPVAFASFLRTSDAVITSHSPERLLLLSGDRAETAPIKGTLDRGTDALLRSAKDAAEHVMIVDLCRNDLGRNARYGSVEVPQLREALELRGLVHMISRVTARIEPGRRARVLEDLFPGGSITGAPKRRAMEIISELEAYRRGPYTGTIGYIDVHGRADWNIAIRTAVWQDGRVHFGCGGGIVLDSDPDAEYEEALLKASSFFDSLREAERATPPPPATSSPGTTP